MTKKRSKAKGNLGRNIIKDRFKGMRSTKGERSLAHTSDLDDGRDWARLGGVSITEQGALDAFIETAALANTDFTAERMNAQLISKFENEALPTPAKMKAKKHAEAENMAFLRIPRRPAWTRTMAKEELHEKEAVSFLEWRRGLAELEETDDILLTPFERNLDFWRQLWRVVERSDVVVQIVDARNPLLFRCTDVEEYVHEVDPQKRNLLLVNKADLLTDEQREQWGDYFTAEGIEFIFFSAALEGLKLQEEEDRIKQLEAEAAQAEALRKSDPTYISDDDDDDEEEENEDDAKEVNPEPGADDEIAEDGAEKTGRVGIKTATTTTTTSSSSSLSAKTDKSTDALAPSGDDDKAASYRDETSSASVNDASKRAEASPISIAAIKKDLGKEGRDEIFDVEALLLLFKALGAAVTEKEKPTIGLVGYPNVGKSSTINAMCKSKKVSVSATPGKTKHFQTILLPAIELCDCPGLVFPNFANTKAELVCNGILPIDQLRDVIPPATYVTQNVSRQTLEKLYGISIIAPAEGEDPNRPPTALEFLNAYSFARGFMNARGLPDISRGARIVLKDFVKGRLLFCKPPPGHEQILTADEKYDAPEYKCMDAAPLKGPRHKPAYMNKVDEEFFNQTEVKVVHNKASHARNKQQKNMSKKHNNKNKREKTRRKMVATEGGY